MYRYVQSSGLAIDSFLRSSVWSHLSYGSASSPPLIPLFSTFLE